MNTLTLIDLPNADASSGNSLLSTIMQLSIAVSIAAASLLLDSFGGHSATSGKAVETAFHATFATIGAIAAASSFIFALVDKVQGNHPQTEKSSLKRKFPPCSGTGRGISRIKRTATAQTGRGTLPG